MISWRQADLIDTLRSKRSKVYPCKLELVFPVDENNQNISDREEEYMGILNLELDPNIPLNDYMAIRDKVNGVLAPNIATTDEDVEDRRKFFSGPNVGFARFGDSSLLNFENKIRRIATGPVTENISEYQNDEDIDRITIGFSIEV